ncbi:hypothetical protein [Phaeovulum sp.]|uniref:hypothetical protein n=1 Tax=Phaeovulum sp. TaxID=2934796 RepID=UPI002730D5C1|nr:hypothetical protein [Phaeovulum sp.]MDP1669745.1 hypothetical protein [Phaeovulum sp.]MDP2063251.1 hypothetical protein [Phaeovulum sp.]MDP3862738.1 hypothetical protein [Phaeovulum sp.]MDZ4119033.1 hypothetical protein [Phaeovulum sp.]
MRRTILFCTALATAVACFALGKAQAEGAGNPRADTGFHIVLAPDGAPLPDPGLSPPF